MSKEMDEIQLFCILVCMPSGHQVFTKIFSPNSVYTSRALNLPTYLSVYEHLKSRRLVNFWLLRVHFILSVTELTFIPVIHMAAFVGCVNR